MYIHVYYFQWHRSPRETLLASVRIGGDVDSCASIAMGLLGCLTHVADCVASYTDRSLVEGCGLYWGGATGLPLKLLDDLEALEYLVELAGKFEKMFPLLS